MPSTPSRKPSRLSAGLIALLCAGTAAAMVGAAFAAVPLYRAFCQATGFDGTPKRATGGPGAVTADRTVSVRFDTNVRGLDWTLTPEITRQTAQVGRTQLVNFTIANDSDQTMTGRATYNVSPDRAARYFVKLQCFCFSDQTIPAHTAKTFPMVYYVDAKFADDPDTRKLPELTLSYTMFAAPKPKG